MGSSSLQFINNSHNASSSSIRSIRQSAAARPISSTCARFAQGYGDGEGDPKGETPKIKDHQTARSTMLNIQDQHRPVRARELELDLPRAVAHQRKLRHSQEDQEARRQRKLDPAQQAARLERAENKEFEQGHDRAPPAAEDKVDKKFWQGKGGSADHE